MGIDRKEDWHLDKRVPITLIVVLILQTFSMAWFLATLSEQVRTNQRNIGRNSAELMQHESVRSHGNVAAELAALKATQTLILARQAEIIRALEKINTTILNGRTANDGQRE